MTGAPPRATTAAGWRVRSEQATLALVCAVVVGLIAGVLAGLHGRGDVAVQVSTARAVAGGHALRQPVTVAAPPPGSPTVTVLSGLSPGAVVVVAPPQILHDGSGVRTTPYAAPGAP
jgi:hypothetical protein